MLPSGTIRIKQWNSTYLSPSLEDGCYTVHKGLPQVGNTHGDILYVPGYRYEEVEEVISPAIPGKPIEPYVGLTWSYHINTFVIISLLDNGGGYYAINTHLQSKPDVRLFKRITDLPNYPHTDPTPADIKKNGAWVKLEY